jgi:hypothetical protein
MFAELFPDQADAGAVLPDIARDFAFALMQGVAVQRLFPHGERPAADYVEALKQVFNLVQR